MTLARRVSAIKESVTLKITSKAKKMLKDGIDVVGLAAGEPDFDTPAHIKDAALKAIKEGFTKYTPASGMPEIREAIAKKFKIDNNIDYVPQQIIVSNGAKHSLYNAIQALCNPGDEVIIPAPYWLSYPAMVTLAEAKPIFVKTSIANGFKMVPDDFAAMISDKTRCLILNSPSNPTGCVYEKGDLEEIAGIAVKHNIYIISDEIYEKLIYDGKKHFSTAAIGKDVYERTITVNGVSKSYSMTGWRIGYAAGPLDVMKAVGNMQSHATSNPASISQKAALAALVEDQAFIESMKSEYEARRDYMASRIGAMKNISCFKPGGAFYMFCDISKTGKGSLEVASSLLEDANVAVIPGEPFGADNFIRLSFATSMENIRKGLDRMEGFFK